MKSKFFWLFFLLLTFLITLPMSWLLLSKVDFFYASLHDNIGIDQHIQRYAPRNRYNKMEFEKTTKTQRVELFHGVVKAIHNKGEGLASLSYIQQSTNKKIRLFTQAEVIHLQDVAVLLEKLKPVVAIAMLMWLLIITLLLMKKVEIPTAKQFSLYALILTIISVLILFTGPERVFNQLHIWVFPDNHQWFFYYEESLMSTMMKAPDLFAYISIIWACVSILFTIVLIRLLAIFSRQYRETKIRKI